VTVSFSCADGLSGLASNTVSGGSTQSAETATGSFTNTGSCTDHAGDSATPVSFTPIKIDKTAPVISSSAVANALPYVAGSWTRSSDARRVGKEDRGWVQSGNVKENVATEKQARTAHTSGTDVSSNGDRIDNGGNSDAS